MAEISVTRIDKDGLDITDTANLTDASTGDHVVFSHGLLLFMRNNDTASCDVTISARASSIDNPSYGDVSVSDLSFTLSQDDVKALTVPQGYAENNKITFTLSNTTDFEIGAFSLNP